MKKKSMLHKILNGTFSSTYFKICVYKKVCYFENSQFSTFLLFVFSTSELRTKHILGKIVGISRNKSAIPQFNITKDLYS